MEQEEEGGEAHAEEEEDEEVGNQLLDEGEDEPIQPPNDDPNWTKDPDYQPPTGAIKKTKKVRWTAKLFSQVDHEASTANDEV